MAPATLPTELIKHILELLAEDVSSHDLIRRDPPFDNFCGENVPMVFSPLFRVSKAFYAAALPSAVRHLVVSDHSFKASDLLARYRQQIDCIACAKRAGVTHHIRSIQLIEVLTEAEEAALLEPLTRLQSLACFSLPQNVRLLPPTLVSLSISASCELDKKDLLTFAEASPNLSDLRIQGNFWEPSPPYDHSPVNPVKCGWSLKHLVLRRSAESDEQALSWIEDAAPTLISLTLDGCGDPDTGFHESISFPLPRLRRLTVGRHDYVDQPNALLSQALLPSIETLDLWIRVTALSALLELPPTVTAVSLAFLKLRSPGRPDAIRALATLVRFVNRSPLLRLLSLDWSISLKRGDYDELKTVCADRDIILASSDSACWPVEDDLVEDEFVEDELFEDELEAAVEAHNEPESSSEEIDFDAEDDEMWVEHWSEEKREAMGLPAKVDGAVDSA